MWNKTITLFILTVLCFYQMQFYILIGAETKIEREQTVVLKAITRHDSTIYNKYETAFKEKYPTVSDIQWLEISDVENWKTAMQSSDVDIVWGDCPTIFMQLADANLLSPFQDPVLINYIRSNISKTIGGSPMLLENKTTDEIVWVSTAISSYGFTLNHDNVEAYNLPIPKTWEDLASPAYYLGNTQHAVAMGDAVASATCARVYQIILQKFGWEAGWDILTRIAGNAVIFEGTAGPYRDAINTGDQAVSITVDYYGYQAMIQDPACEYIIPRNESIVDPIPIGVTTSSANRVLAEAFIKFVISDEGQSFWLDKSINRLPVIEGAFLYAEAHGYGRPELYQTFLDTRNNPTIFFDNNLAVAINDIVNFYFQGVLTHSRMELYAAWESIVNASNQELISVEEVRSLTREMSRPAIMLSEAMELQKDYLADPKIKDDLVIQFKSEATTKYGDVDNQVEAESSDTDNDGKYFNEFKVSIESPKAGSVVTNEVTVEFSAVEYGGGISYMESKMLV